jgi:hypothetical protein
VILGTPGFRISDMVSALNLAGEDVVVDISYILDAFLSEKDCGTR